MVLVESMGRGRADRAETVRRSFYLFLAMDVHGRT